MRQWMWPIIVLGLVCGIGYGARWAIGTIYGSGEAIQLLRSLSQSGLYLGSASATASATILALMLTLIGVVRRSDQDFDDGVYSNILRIAQISTVTLMTSLLLLLALVFPIGEFENLPRVWYEWMYNGLFAATVITIGLLASTIVMLYQTIYSVIAKVTPGERA